MSLARTFVLKTSSLPLVERMVRRSFLFRPLVRRFIAGDTLEEAIKASEALLAKGLRISLDYLGENTRSEQEALDAKATYIQMLERIAQVPVVRDYNANPVGPEPLNISIKLTQCGLDQGEAFAEKNYRDVLEVAKGFHNFVRIDMESSDYTDRTMAMIGRVRPDYPNTGTVLQSYLYRTPKDVEQVIEWQARTRIVKGAYLEPPSVAYPEKEKVDEAYVQQAKELLLRGYYPAIATQDEKIIRELNAFVAENKIDKSRFEYQMLYGIRRDLQDSLVAEGYNVRIYVPFGDSWYPYFTRRLAERPANAFFILKAMFKG
ncbi:proline dehydrogenase family protein [Fimbriimonas ginsengisoli]|uniref:proline dehydrogenase n=1 Tax=Fimbriimonas ginsengisoli Gsoil 348 TaxID=661478 RepID=A0A068NTX9_FIMGI|nr:proline dehydrogenase family protein [Fimbriimonas ginsengisoli]AIE86896.1 Proline dehydrogenase [Fimbriimonas ginsengisoli Gsoil 348]